MALCGNTDINVWAEIWHWRTPRNSPQSAVRQFLREDTSSVTYARNLLNVNVLALQGEADPIVNQRHARSMQQALKSERHSKNAFHLLPYVTHGFGVNYELGLRDMVREPKPLRVRYKTAWLRYSGANWLTIAGIEKRLRHASIDGIADPIKKTLKIKTSNVTGISIITAQLPFKRPAKISIDGKAVDPKKLKFSKNDSGAWTTALEAKVDLAFPPKKTASVEGPLEHAFMTPFTLATCQERSDPLADAANAAAAAFNAQWKTRFAVPCRQKSAASISADDIAATNLILFGNPQTNPLVARVVNHLPLAFRGDCIVFGAREYSGDNLGVMLCFPNPLNPNRYVAFMSGTTPRSYADLHVRFGNWFDWVPFDYRKHFDFAIFDDLTCGRHPESFLVWGFFDENWRVARSQTFSAVPAFRRRLLPRVFPTMDLSKQHPARVYLDDAFAASENVAKEYLERNRTLEGCALQLLGKNYKRGLCCRFPSSIVFPSAGYRKFKATAGVGWDGTTEPCDDRKTFEHVHVTVHADSKLVFESGGQTWRSKPLRIDVELGDAKTITLSANGGLSWLNGSFIWADAELY